LHTALLVFQVWVTFQVTACLRDFSRVIGLICGIDTLFLYQLEQLLHLIHIQIMFLFCIPMHAMHCKNRIVVLANYLVTTVA